MSFRPGARSLGLLLAAGLGAVAVTATLPLRSSGQQDAVSTSASDGLRLPHADPPFRGVANRTLDGSKPAFPQPAAAPEGWASNVLIVLIDDAGFGNPSTFGGPARRPRSRSWHPRVCGTTDFMSRASAPRPGPRCCRAATTTP